MDKTFVKRKAQKLFKHHGIKSIRMDDIADELNVSKRTLYENFDSKEMLLREILKDIEKYDTRNIASLYTDNININDHSDLIKNIEILTSQYENLKKKSYNIFKSKQSQFFYELKKFYKKLYQSHIDIVVDLVAKKISFLIQGTQKQNLLRDDISPKGAYEFFKIELNALNETKSVTKKIDNQNILNMLFDFYFRSALNDKGLNLFVINQKTETEDLVSEAQ